MAVAINTQFGRLWPKMSHNQKIPPHLLQKNTVSVENTVKRVAKFSKGVDAAEAAQKVEMTILAFLEKIEKEIKKCFSEKQKAVRSRMRPIARRWESGTVLGQDPPNHSRPCTS